MKIEQIKETITIVNDYPIKGIVFKDITTLLENPDAFKSTVDIMIEKVKHLDFNRVVGVESRGFFWSGSIAYALFITRRYKCSDFYIRYATFELRNLSVNKKDDGRLPV